MKKFKEILRKAKKAICGTVAVATIVTSAPATAMAMPADAPAVAEAQAVSEQKAATQDQGQKKQDQKAAAKKADQKQTKKAASKIVKLTLSAKNDWHLREGQIVTDARVKKAALAKITRENGKTNSNYQNFSCSQVGKVVRPDKNGQYKLTIKAGGITKTIKVAVIRMSRISSAYSYYHPTEGDKFDETAFRPLSAVFAGFEKGADKKITSYSVKAPKTIAANKKGFAYATVSYGSFSKKVKFFVKEKQTQQATEPTQPSQPKPEQPVQVTEAIVKNQAELTEVLLKHPELKTLTISTTASERFVINGSYPEVALTIDAPNSEVYNFAKFGSIRIEAISANSFYEFAKGNAFDVLAMSGRLVIMTKASSTVSFNRESANFNLAVNGQATVTVSRKMSLDISGEVAKVPVVIGVAAEGTSLTASVPLSLEMLAKANVTLVTGAKGSVIYNRASQSLYVNTPQGNILVVANGSSTYSPSGNNSNSPSESNSSNNNNGNNGTSNPSEPSSPSENDPSSPSESETKATIEILSTEGGRVLIGDGNTEVKSDTPFKADLLLNSKLPLKPEAYPGHEFDKWSDGVKDAERVLTVKQAISLKAIFKTKTEEHEDITIALSVSGNGKIVDENGETISSSVTFKDNEQKTVEAVSNNSETDVFVNWSDGETTAKRVLTKNSPKELTANFKATEPVEPEDVTIALSVSGNGKIVDENGETISSSVTFKDNEQKNVEAVSNNDETDVFVNWSDGETTAKRVLTKDSPKSLTANFVEVNKVVGQFVVGTNETIAKIVSNAIVIPTPPTREKELFKYWSLNGKQYNESKMDALVEAIEAEIEAGNTEIVVTAVYVKACTITIENGYFTNPATDEKTIVVGEGDRVDIMADEGYNAWTEGKEIVTNDPDYPFLANGNRTLTAVKITEAEKKPIFRVSAKQYDNPYSAEFTLDWDIPESYTVGITTFVYSYVSKNSGETIYETQTVNAKGNYNSGFVFTQPFSLYGGYTVTCQFTMNITDKEGKSTALTSTAFPMTFGEVVKASNDVPSVNVTELPAVDLDETSEANVVSGAAVNATNAA